jgi:hypothetical protein
MVLRDAVLESAVQLRAAQPQHTELVQHRQQLDLIIHGPHGTAGRQAGSIDAV